MFLPNLMLPPPMAFKRGGVYLVNLNPSKGTEPGKMRPCVVVQSNFLNDVEHPSTTVLPLTTQLIDDAQPLRFPMRQGLLLPAPKLARGAQLLPVPLQCHSRCQGENAMPYLDD